MMLVVVVLGGLLCLIAFLVKNYLIVFGIILILIAVVSFIVYPKLEEASDRTYNQG